MLEMRETLAAYLLASFDCVCPYDKLLAFMQYSFFGSILTIGAIIGALVSGRLADYAGRRVVSFSDYTCVLQRVCLPLNRLFPVLFIVLRLFCILQSRPWDSRRCSASWDGLP